MSHSLYVTNLPPVITLEKLLIYFSSKKHSGGGDVDLDACKLNDDTAVVMFEKSENLDRVLQRKHEIDGYKLEISDKPIKTKVVPNKRTKTPAKEKKSIMVERAPDMSSNNTTSQPEWMELESRHTINDDKVYLEKARTVIVSDICPDTTNESIQMFFKNKRRTGGGTIEKFERCQRTVAHITFVSAEVASRVLQHDNLELEGCLLKVVGKQPKLVLPLDRKKLFVENMNPKTTKDCLMNYFEVITKKGVCDVQFGVDGNALIDFDEEPDLKELLENKKPLEGAILKISHPLVCNSILITGLSKNTTKEAIETYFGNKKHGGGKIYGEIIHERDEGKAVVSYCDPNVIQKLTCKKQTLNGFKLSIKQYYPFMETLKEASVPNIRINSDVIDDSIEPQKGMNRFIVEEIPFCRKLLDHSKDKLTKMITELTNQSCTVTIENDLPLIKVVGIEQVVNQICELVAAKIGEFQEELNVVTKDLHLPEQKLRLFVLHDIGEMLKNNFNVEVDIQQQDERIRIKGSERQVFSAASLVYQKCSQIKEDVVELTDMKGHFLQAGGLDKLNSDIKAKGLKGIISLSDSKANKVKVLVFDGTTIEDVHSFVTNNMFQQSYELDEDSLTLLESNKWKEFYEDVTKNSSVIIYTDANSSSEILLIGKESEVKQAFESINEFMKRNTIISESIHLGEGNTRFLAEFCANDLEEMERKLKQHDVRVRMEDGRIIIIDGTKEGVTAAKRYLHDIVSSIARGTISLDNLGMQKYLDSEEGNVFLAGIESVHTCIIRLNTDGKSSALKPSTLNVEEGTSGNTKKLFLEIYAGNNATVNLVKKTIFNCMESQKKKVKIEDENIRKLSKQQTSEITHLCKITDVKLTLEKEFNRIVLFGLSEDIKNIVCKIYKILKRIGKGTKGKAEIDANLARTVSQGIQWLWIDPDNGDYKSYDKHATVKIEKAFSRGETSVIFLFDKKICEIEFDKMEEKNLKTNETTKVTRKAAEVDILVPEHWEPQPRDGNGKELESHYVSLNPNNPRHKDEYRKVSDHFLLTHKARISQIQRIQNPALFKQYMMMKKSLGQKFGSHEKTLFHHRQEANGDIVGRSYAKVDGISFGKGVYFARDASLLAGPVDPATNKKYLYMARVAVGEYTLGDHSMVRPPLKETNSIDSYDSTVNNTVTPTIFVTYNDNQFYLEYLIIFS